MYWKKELQAILSISSVSLFGVNYALCYVHYDHEQQSGEKRFNRFGNNSSKLPFFNYFGDSQCSGFNLCRGYACFSYISYYEEPDN